MTRRDLLKLSMASSFAIKTTTEHWPTHHARLVSINVTSGALIREKDLAKSYNELSVLLDKELAEVKRALLFGFQCCAKDQLT